MSSEESSPPPSTSPSTHNNQKATRNNNVQIPNIKLLLKDNFTYKKCYRCQQLGSFQCEHSTKYRDELKEMKEAKGKLSFVFFLFQMICSMLDYDCFVYF